MAFAHVTRLLFFGSSQALAFLSGREDLLMRSRFDAWYEYVQNERGRRDTLGRSVVVRLRNRLLAQCWETWYAYPNTASLGHSHAPPYRLPLAIHTPLPTDLPWPPATPSPSQ